MAVETRPLSATRGRAHLQGGNALGAPSPEHPSYSHRERVCVRMMGGTLS